MKQLKLVLLMIMISVSICAQGNYKVEQNDNTYKFKCSEGIRFILDDFFKLAKEENLDLSRLPDLQSVYAIGSAEMEILTGRRYNVGAGSLTEDGKYYIYVNGDLPYIPTFMSGVIYHEFYHFFTRVAFHCDEESCLNILNTKLNIERIIKTWDTEAKKEYFKYLKSLM